VDGSVGSWTSTQKEDSKLTEGLRFLFGLAVWVVLVVLWAIVLNQAIESFGTLGLTVAMGVGVLVAPVWAVVMTLRESRRQRR
jgi:hypothetical protein